MRRAAAIVGIGQTEFSKNIGRPERTVALEAIEKEPRVHGSFLWKWFPGNVRARNFDKSAPAMRGVMRKIWREPAD